MTDNPTTTSPFFRGVQSLADYLGVSEKTISRAMRKHLLPYTKLGGAVIFRRAEVEDALARLSVPAIGQSKHVAKKGA